MDGWNGMGDAQTGAMTGIMHDVWTDSTDDAWMGAMTDVMHDVQTDGMYDASMSGMYNAQMIGTYDVMYNVWTDSDFTRILCR